MERILLCGLSWRCHAPTAHQIGLSILSLLLPYVDIPEVTWGFLIDEMKYLTELAVREYYFSTQRTSTIAVAAIFNAISVTSTKECEDILTDFLRVIMESFEFDHSKHIAAARTRLRCLAMRGILLQEDDVDEEVWTSQNKHSRCQAASPRSRREVYSQDHGHSWYEEDEWDHEPEDVVSPSSSLRDFSRQKQDLQC